MGISTPRSKLWLQSLIALMSIVWLFYGSWVIFKWGGEPLRKWIGDLSQTFPILLASVVCFSVSTAHSGANRLGWRFMGLGVLAWGTGNAIWSFYELVLKQQPFPSFADAGYLTAPPLMIIGLLLFPRPTLSRTQNLQLGLDVGILVGAMGTLLWPFLLAPAIQNYGQVSLAMILGLAYPVMDLALIGLLLSILLRRPEHTLGSDKALLALGLIFLVIADLSFNALSAAEVYQTGSPTDLFWIAWGITFALAAYSSLSANTLKRLEHYLRQLKLNQIGVFAPYVAVLLVYGLVFLHHNTPGLIGTGVVIAAGLVTLLVIARQTLTLLENQRLTRQLQGFNYALESRVEARTLELAEQREQLLAAEKLASLGRLTAGIAHEINTPLAASMNHLLQARKLAEEYKDSIGVKQVTEADHLEIAAELGTTLQQTNASLERMGEFIRKMRAQSRNPDGAIAGFDPVRVARETLALLENQAIEAGVRLELQAPAQTLTLHGEAGRFSQVLNNLIQNAIHACENRSDGQVSQVVIGIEQSPKYLLVRVSDNGSGIAAEVLPKIFDPLFTTKPVGKGTGLGLPIIRDIVKGHFGGDITLETELNKGTTFTAEFPLKAAAPTPEKVIA